MLLVARVRSIATKEQSWVATKADSARCQSLVRSIAIKAEGARCQSPEDSPIHHEVSRHSQFFHFDRCVSLLRECCRKACIRTTMCPLFLQRYTPSRSARTLHQYVLFHRLPRETKRGAHISSSTPLLLVPTWQFLTSLRSGRLKEDVFLGAQQKRRLLAPTPVSPIWVLVTVAMQVMHLVHIAHQLTCDVDKLCRSIPSLPLKRAEQARFFVAFPVEKTQVCSILCLDLISPTCRRPRRAVPRVRERTECKAGRYIHVRCYLCSRVWFDSLQHVSTDTYKLKISAVLSW